MSNITWGWTSPTRARGNFEVKIDIKITEVDLSGLHEVIHHRLDQVHRGDHYRLVGLQFHRDDVV